MKKDTQVSLRVRGEELKKIKGLGFSYSDCWDLGYERILENERDELEKLSKKYHNLYIHVCTKLEQFGKKTENERDELENLLTWYEKQNRSIKEPTGQDLQALRLQMKKRDIKTFTINQVLDYWKENKEKIK